MQLLSNLPSLGHLKNSKNLLAFSGGGDSTALFFLLLKHDISFDVAHINYKTRKQSDDEEEYAKKLCKMYDKRLFSGVFELEKNNFEHQARVARYSFFEDIIQKENYETLLTAHHLGDRLEWFLMQLCKGAGVVEMLGMNECEQKDGYLIVRPLLGFCKEEILDFLNQNEILYFEDETNKDEAYLRNHFRHNYATPLLNAHKKGILQSFIFLQNDAKRLLPHSAKQINELFILPNDEDMLINIRQIDKVVKRLGLLLSQKQREEIVKSKECVVGGKIAICFSETKIFIAPYKTDTMPKKFKEECRIAKIPLKIRPYLFCFNIKPSSI